MRTEPLNGGTAPLRTSKNKTLGVIDCPTCGEPMTVHKPTGKRSNVLYSICDNCGTDQRAGKPYQAYLAQYKPNIEALEAEKLAIEPEPETEPLKPEIKPEPEQIETVQVTLSRPKPEPETQTEPEPNETKVSKPLIGIVIGGFIGGLLAVVK